MVGTKKRVFMAGAFASAMIAAVLGLCAPNSAWAAQESEPNNSFNQADSVTIGTTMNGSVVDKYWMSSFQSDEDYFAINIPQAGNYKITYRNTEYHSEYNNIRFDLYNNYYQEIKNFYTGTRETKPESDTLALNKGTYYLKVYRGIPEVYTSYSFKVSPVINKTSITKLTAGKKRATVKFSKKSGSSKYEIRYATNSKMTGAKKVSVKASKNSSTIKKLKKGKKYYFQVRVVKSMAGKTFYSNWSTKKSVKITR